MAVYVSNIVIEQGYDFETSFQLEDTRTNSPLDLSGTISEGQLRKHYTASTAVSFASSVTDPLGGTITISLTNDQTANLKSGRYVYDIKIISSAGKEYKAVEGAALVRAGVTR
jgi:4-hydroxy-3-methylbut-2-en-1-yl diphosphate synthase IspG/GcpE